MIVYNVWFSLKEGSDETLEIRKVKLFLKDLQDRALIAGYRVLKNRAQAGKSKLPPYQIIAEFLDGNQFGLPFAEVERIGIHSGRHGSMIENVDEFVVEIFEDL
jgi:hypothetical protein